MGFERFEDENYVKWAKRVKERDRYACQICGRTQNLNSHHINSWDKFVRDRYDLSCGITLCTQCHGYLHAAGMYGKGFNTRFQFEEFKTLATTIIGIIKRDHEAGNLASLEIKVGDDGYGASEEYDEDDNGTEI